MKYFSLSGLAKYQFKLYYYSRVYVFFFYNDLNDLTTNTPNKHSTPKPNFHYFHFHNYPA